jgi:hypothetical protein
MANNKAMVKPPVIFISYVKGDEKTAQTLRAALIDAGYYVSTLGTEVTPGERWVAKIYDAISTADIIVLLLSKEAVKSRWVDYESAAAIASVERSSNKRVLPVSLDKSIKPSGLLASYQWIISNGSPSDVAEVVLQAIASARPIDKAKERADARQGLEESRSVLDVLRRGQEESYESWTAALRLLMIVTLAFVSMAVIIALVITRNASVSAALSVASGVLGLTFGMVGFFSGRWLRGSIAKRDGFFSTYKPERSDD